jgi:hypothetical protein
MVLRNQCKLYEKTSWRARLFLIFSHQMAGFPTPDPLNRASGFQIRFENMVLLHSKNLLSLANRLP